MKELPIIQNNETPDFCNGCGRCCQMYAGWYHPEQVIPMLEEFKKTGKLPEGIRIDCWTYDGEDHHVFVLKPAHTNAHPKTLYDVTFGGICVNLTEKGCKLTWEERPLMCKSLVGNEEKKCINPTWDKVQLMEEWLPYQHYLDRYTKNVDFIINEDRLPLVKLAQFQNLINGLL